jgi:hypothetical protein
MHSPTDHEAQAVGAVSAAGRGNGNQYLTATFGDSCTFLRAYSRNADRWADWVQLHAGPDGRHASAWTNEKDVGVGLCFDVAGQTWFGEPYHHHDGRSFDDLDDFLVWQLPSPWDSRTVSGLASASRGERRRDYFFLFEDLSLVHLESGAKTEQISVLRPARTLPFPSAN